MKRPVVVKQPAMESSTLRLSRLWQRIMLLVVLLPCILASASSTSENSIDAIACAASAAQDILAAIAARNGSTSGVGANTTTSFLLDKLLAVGSDCFGANLVKPKPLRILAPDITQLSVWRARAQAYEAANGISVIIDTLPFWKIGEEILDMASRTNSSLYDGWIFDPYPTGGIALVNGFADLSQLIKETPSLVWSDYHPFYRGVSGVFGGKIIGIPMDGDLYLMYYRRDLFQRYGLDVPQTWDDYVAIATAMNGTDTDGDGVPDLWGTCLDMMPLCKIPFNAAAILAPYLQYGGTIDGLYLDPDPPGGGGLTTLVGNNPATAEMLRMLKALERVRPPQLTCGNTHPAFQGGNCLMTINWGNEFRESPLHNLSGPGKLGVARLPGSTQVLNRTTKLLVNCTSALCPYSEPYVPARVGPNGRMSTTPPGSLVNRAPFPAFGGWTGGVSSSATPEAQLAVLRFYATITSPDHSWTDLLDKYGTVDPFRSSHLDPANLWRWERAGYDSDTTVQYLAAVQSSLSSQNVALDSRLAYSQRSQGGYRNALEFGVPAALADMGNMTANLKYIESFMSTTLAMTIEELPGQDPLALRQVYYQLLSRPGSPYPSPPPRPDSYQRPLPPGYPGSSRDQASQVEPRVIAPAVVIPVVATVLLGLLLLRAYRSSRKAVHRSLRGQVIGPKHGAGTTLVITDIQDSTTIYETLPPEVADHVVGLCNRVTRTLLDIYDGYESATEGDSFICAFHGPDTAVLFCSRLQEALLLVDWPSEVLMCAQVSSAHPVWINPCKRYDRLMQVLFPHSPFHRVSQEKASPAIRDAYSSSSKFLTSCWARLWPCCMARDQASPPTDPHAYYAHGAGPDPAWATADVSVRGGMSTMDISVRGGGFYTSFTNQFADRSNRGTRGTVGGSDSDSALALGLVGAGSLLLAQGLETVAGPSNDGPALPSIVRSLGAEEEVGLYDSWGQPGTATAAAAAAKPGLVQLGGDPAAAQDCEAAARGLYVAPKWRLSHDDIYLTPAEVTARVGPGAGVGTAGEDGKGGSPAASQEPTVHAPAQQVMLQASRTAGAHMPLASPSAGVVGDAGKAAPVPASDLGFPLAPAPNERSSAGAQPGSGGGGNSGGALGASPPAGTSKERRLSVIGMLVATATAGFSGTSDRLSTSGGGPPSFTTAQRKSAHAAMMSPVEWVEAQGLAEQEAGCAAPVAGNGKTLPSAVAKPSSNTPATATVQAPPEAPAPPPPGPPPPAPTSPDSLKSRSRMLTWNGSGSLPVTSHIPSRLSSASVNSPQPSPAGTGAVVQVTAPPSPSLSQSHVASRSLNDLITALNASAAPGESAALVQHPSSPTLMGSHHAPPSPSAGTWGHNALPEGAPSPTRSSTQVLLKVASTVPSAPWMGLPSSTSAGGSVGNNTAGVSAPYRTTSLGGLNAAHGQVSAFANFSNNSAHTSVPVAHPSLHPWATPPSSSNAGLTSVGSRVAGLLDMFGSNGQAKLAPAQQSSFLDKQVSGTSGGDGASIKTLSPPTAALGPRPQLYSLPQLPHHFQTHHTSQKTHAREPVAVFSGPRIRCGIHTGITRPEDVVLNPSSGRLMYRGEAMAMARAVVDSAHGAQLMMSQATFIALTPSAFLAPSHMQVVGANRASKGGAKKRSSGGGGSWRSGSSDNFKRRSKRDRGSGDASLQSRLRARRLTGLHAKDIAEVAKAAVADAMEDEAPIAICHMGEYTLTNLGATLSAGYAVQSLYTAVPRSLAARMLMLGTPRLDAWRLKVQGVLGAPQGSPSLTVVFMHAQGIQELLAWNVGITEQALELYEQTTKALLMSKEVDQGGGGGYLVEAAGPLVLAAFSCPASALRWALSVLEALTQLEAWPQELLAHPLGEELHLAGPSAGSTSRLRGLRVKAGAATGKARAMLHESTGRIAYRGKLMNRAARVASAASSGRLLVTSSTWGKALLLERQHRLMQPIHQHHQHLGDAAPQQQHPHHQQLSQVMTSPTRSSPLLTIPAPLHSPELGLGSVMPSSSPPPALSSSPLSRFQLPAALRISNSMVPAGGDHPGNGGGGSARTAAPGSPTAAGQAGSLGGGSGMLGGGGLTRLFKRPSTPISNNSTPAGPPSKQPSIEEGGARGGAFSKSVSAQMTDSHIVTACHSGCTARALTATSLGEMSLKGISEALEVLDVRFITPTTTTSTQATAGTDM